MRSHHTNTKGKRILTKTLFGHIITNDKGEKKFKISPIKFNAKSDANERICKTYHFTRLSHQGDLMKLTPNINTEEAVPATV